MKRLFFLSNIMLLPALVIAEVQYSEQYIPCMDKSGGVTSKMRNCNSNELKYQDQLLNKNYRLATRLLGTKHKTKLKEVQQQWIKYRDAKCTFLSDLTGGTIDSIASGDCYVDMTAKRALELKSIINMMQYKEVSTNTNSAQRANQPDLFFATPLKGCYVVQKYGKHRDLEYNLTVSAESIILAPFDGKAEVHAVDNGTVTFVGETSVLEKVVVISHRDSKWQSVYIGFKSIDPALRKGMQISKNSILGKAKNRLIFQLLHKGNFVDPERFIIFTNKL